MSSYSTSAELTRLRRQLAQAAAEEHRLHQVALQEREAERRWQRRSELAASRGLQQLADEALARAIAHRQRAGYLEAEFFEQRAYVENLRQAVRNPELANPVAVRHRTARVDPDQLERRLAELEEEARLEKDLAQLKQRRQPTGEPPP